MKARHGQAGRHARARSQHGLGIAADLCGGVQSFGTRGAPVDAPERPAVRVVPPRVGRAGRVACPSRGTGSSPVEHRPRLPGPRGCVCQASHMISAAPSDAGHDPAVAAAPRATSAPGTGTTGPTRPTSPPPRRSCSRPYLTSVAKAAACPDLADGAGLSHQTSDVLGIPVSPGLAGPLHR